MTKRVKSESLEAVHTHTHTHTHTRRTYRIIKKIEKENTSEKIDIKGLKLIFNHKINSKEENVYKEKIMFVDCFKNGEKYNNSA